MSSFETCLRFFLHHQHLHPHTFSTLVPPCVTLSHYFFTVMCPTYTPPCPATSTLPPFTSSSSSSSLHSLRWGQVIFGSVRSKPAHYCHTPPPPPPLPPFHLSWAKSVSSSPLGAKGSDTRLPPPPPPLVPSSCTEFLCLHVSPSS